MAEPLEEEGYSADCILPHLEAKIEILATGKLVAKAGQRPNRFVTVEIGKSRVACLRVNPDWAVTPALFEMVRKQCIKALDVALAEATKNSLRMMRQQKNKEN